jgi:hypothetical protein
VTKRIAQATARAFSFFELSCEAERKAERKCRTECIDQHKKIHKHREKNAKLLRFYQESSKENIPLKTSPILLSESDWTLRQTTRMTRRQLLGFVFEKDI